ncbi:MAG TPA: hypothetical protein P5055_16205 [Candidatus Paceibacterota bacterium]|nr:hypothetical protein [Candidatus Paceibacterota bacterium]
MSFLKKKPDPISDKAKSLNSRIAELEGEIKQLSQTLNKAPATPRVRSSIYPHTASPDDTRQRPGQSEPSAIFFEKVDHERIHKNATDQSTAGRFNQLGVRKFDLPALWRRFREHFQGPSPANPKLVHLMAAGTVQGLRPLRVEKRIARRRFLLLVAVLLVLLWGLAGLFFR